MDKFQEDWKEWLSEDFDLKCQWDIESIQEDLRKATFAHSYSWIINRNKIRELVANPKKILDIGCGFGRILTRFENSVGIDISLPFLKAAKKISNHPVVIADLHFLPFKSDIFDCVIMSEVIEHISNYEQSFREIKRVLTRGGIIVITTPNRNITRSKFISGEFGHVHEFTPNELKTLLLSHGFVPRVVTGSTIPYIPLKNKFHWLNSNKFFFNFWIILNHVTHTFLSWNIIIIAELK